jgi:hypothetical protein
MPLALTDLEALLRARKLDRTLPSSFPPPAADDRLVAATGIPALDDRLGGGVPRGQLSEVVGPRSSGRTSLLHAMMAAATHRGELAALVDTLDTFDPSSAPQIDLPRLLWIRGMALACEPGPRLRDLAVGRALKALTLVLQCGNFGLVAIDLASCAPRGVRAIPFTTWMRVQRVIEGTPTACVIVAAEPTARSSAGLSMALGPRAAGAWTGGSARSRRLSGLETEVRIVRARFAAAEDRAAAVRFAADDRPFTRGAEWA